MNKMKKVIAMAAIMMGIMNMAAPQESHALLGLAFKSKPVKIIGAVGAVGGLALGLYGYGIAVTTATLGGVIAGSVFIAYGIVIAGVGLIILDENKIADIEFKAIDVNKPEYYQGFTREQVQTYNSELAQLNSIRQTMIAESNDQADTTDAEALWKTYSNYLSKATVEIAQYNAGQFLKAIH